MFDRLISRRRKALRRKNRGLRVEALETRKLLAGDVMASLSDGVLSVEGDSASNNVVIRSIQREQQDTTVVNDGTTSVFLDLDLLQAAAGLTLVGADGTVPPAEGNFQVGFDITEASTFQFSTDSGFELLGGAIEHTGTVTLALAGEEPTEITIGDFSIGFDESRVSDIASGFFVADTVSLNIPVFDLSPPGEVDFDSPELTIASTDLLVSPELAVALAGEDSGLAGADVGDAQVDALTVAFQQREVVGGKTSVFLNTDLLAEAAGLELTGANGTAVPAQGPFQVAFEISGETDFEFSSGNSFAPVGGSIEHTGSVTFNEELELGNFSIGFDGSREGGSGFFVQDTISLNIPLFDIATPGAVDFQDPSLVISQADLLVSPELAAALGNEALVGAAVGSAQVDAIADSLKEELIQVSGRNRFGRTSVNGGRTAEFSAEAVDSVFVDLGRGSDLVNVRGLDIAGDLQIDLGSGFFNYAVINGSVIGGELGIEGGSRFDGVSVNRSSVGDLSIDTGAGTDFVSLNRTHVARDADINLGSGWFDSLAIWHSEVDGDATLSGGRGRFDRLSSAFSTFGTISINGFERRRFF